MDAIGYVTTCLIKCVYLSVALNGLECKCVALVLGEMVTLYHFFCVVT